MRHLVTTRGFVLPAIVAGALLLSLSGLEAEEPLGLQARQPGGRVEQDVVGSDVAVDDSDIMCRFQRRCNFLTNFENFPPR